MKKPSLIAGALVITLLASFSATSEQKGYIIDHVAADLSVKRIAIPMEDESVAMCHLEYGDTEVPYTEEEFDRIISGQDGGADYACNH